MLTIMELRKEPHTSYSSINTYIGCGLQYWFSKVARLKSEFIPDAMIFGNIIHKTLADFNFCRMKGEVLSLKEVQEVFEEYWERAAKDNDQIRYKKGKDYKNLLTEGQNLLAAFYKNLPDNTFKVLAVEEPFRIELDGLPLPLIGVMDLIEEDSGTIILTDYKAISKAYSVDEVDKDLQLTIYQMGVKSIGYADREILMKFDCLIKTKQPKFEQYYTTRSELDEKRIIKKIQKVWDGINKEIFIPNESWKCKGCTHKGSCEQWYENKLEVSHA